MPRIRKPSDSLRNLPQTWIPKQNDDEVEGYAEAKTNADVVIACLHHLIAELKRKGRFKTRIKLLAGRLVDLHQNTYSFSLEEDENLLEGTRADIYYRDQKIRGTIVSISTATPRFVLVSLDKDLGEQIDECELQTDESSFYEAMLARYEVETGQKHHPSIKKVEADFSLADRALTNDAKTIRHKLTPSVGDLNADQFSFLETALGHDISFLWGPPGTGKTKCLGALIANLYDANERSVITSNTNQAVDQVLLKLCRDMASSGRMDQLEKGLILRLGQVHNKELQSEFGEYINVDAIIERKGQKLEQEATKLRSKLKKLNSSVEELNQIRGYIEELKDLEKEARHRKEALGIEKTSLERVQTKRKHIENSQKELRKEAKKVGKRGFIKEVFGKTAWEIEEELESLDTERNEAVIAQNEAEGAYGEAQSRSKSADALVKKAQTAAKGKTLSEVLRETKGIKKDIKSAEARLADLSKELENVRRGVVTEALVVGCTLTRMHLSPALIGKADNIIVDEASMALMPAFYFAASQAKKRVVVSGDFRQLPPIIETSNSLVKRTMARSPFEVSGVRSSMVRGEEVSNATMLTWQYRMPDEICSHLSDFAYGSKLRTAPGFTPDIPVAPLGYESPLLVIDTSNAKPFSDQDAFGSKSNTIHAVIARRVIRLFASDPQFGSIGYCTPFRSQANLVRSMVKADGLEQSVAAGTVHVFQGDEKDVILFDTVDGLGIAKAGFQISQDHPAQAQLMNVAMSRAKGRMIILANLELLDRQLPAKAFMRTILAAAEEAGAVIQSEDIVALEPIGTSVHASLLERTEEVKQLQAELKLKMETVASVTNELAAKRRLIDRELKSKEAGAKQAKRDAEDRIKEANLLEETLASKSNETNELRSRLSMLEASLTESFLPGSEFYGSLEEDLLRAKSSVVIYSGFVSIKRVGKLLKLFERVLATGVKIRVVVPPPSGRTPFDSSDDISAVEVLTQMGIVVDLRKAIHQKAVLIDDAIFYIGSLNPLSFGGRTEETMMRVAWEGMPMAFARELAVNGPRSIRSTEDLPRAENPPCNKCGGLTVHSRKKGRGVFDCLSCSSEKNVGNSSSKKKTTAASNDADSPECELCGSQMVKRHRKNGDGSFWGCSEFSKSKCTFTINID